MAETVITIPANETDPKRVAAYFCIDPGNVKNMKYRSLEMNTVVNMVYHKSKWKLAQTYLDYEPGLPITERHAYKNLERDAPEDKIDILCMWSIRQLSRERSEITSFLSLLRKHNITLRTHIEEIDSSVISDNLILDLWYIGIGERGSEPQL